MKTFNKQAASLKKNLKQNNLMPLFVVFSVIVMLSLTYKSVSKVNGVGNTMFKEGNRNRRRRVRQGFREGNEDEDDDGDAPTDAPTDDGDAPIDETERFIVKEAMGHKKPDDAPEGFLNGGGIGRKAGFVGKEGNQRRGGSALDKARRKAPNTAHREDYQLQKAVATGDKRMKIRNTANKKNSNQLPALNGLAKS